MPGTENGDDRVEGPDSSRERSAVRIGLALTALLIVAAGAYGLGLVPVGSDGDAAGTPTITPVPTLAPNAEEVTTAPNGDSADTPAESSTESTARTPTTAAGVTVRGDTRQFQFQVLRVESCGQTCRDVDVELTNSGDAATEVAATSRLYAGEAGDDEVWEGTESIGDMAAGETVERTVRIELSIVEGSKVCGADTVTLVTDVVSTEHHQQFTSHPDIEC